MTTADPTPAASAPSPVQLHLVLPYKFQPRDDARIRGLLQQGYRILRYQRLSDREVIVTLSPPGAASPPA